MNLKCTLSFSFRRGQLLCPIRTGFTLIDLLAVIAVLALFTAMLAPICARTRPNITVTQCQNNLRQLGAAWGMYANDSEGQLVYNKDGTPAGKTAGYESWVAGWLTRDWPSTLNNTDNTNVLFLVDHEATPYGAFLGPYIKKPSPFRCPADKLSVTIAGQPMQRVRSYSMNNFVGLKGRTWTSNSRFRLFTKLAQFKAPSQVFVFIEEHPDVINDGFFFSDPDTRYLMIDWPSSIHNGGCTFSFADGHAEIHRWRDARTMPPLYPAIPLQLNVTMFTNVDIDWLHQHASEAHP
ncbi:MAG TPA: prepilin-type N-terminal cleavage/methylation domain-containing protein [Candidatus Sulfotelmatobacter sp.]|nr:prepilin-type N-terminal cleavage/methylation domain-containing protein [Candidatus Sulfotelmatobacter sp.]